MNPLNPTKQQALSKEPLQEIKEEFNPEEQNALDSNELSPKKEEISKQVDYYQEFCKLYLANAVLETHLKELAIEKSELLGKLHKLQVSFPLSKKKAEENQDGNSNSLNQRKKRVRRSAADIARHYKCTHENCSKSYGEQAVKNTKMAQIK